MAKGKYLRKQPVSTGKKIGRIVLIVLLVIILLIGAIIGFVWSKLGKITYDPGVSSETLAPTEVVPTESTLTIDPTDVTDATVEAALPSEEAVEQEGVDVENLTMQDAPSYSQGELFKDKNVMNILLVGTDEYTDGFASTSRGDVNILVSINKAEKTVKLVSFSRGIAIQMLDGPYKGKYEWLTNAHRWAGHEAVIQALSDAFKIELDRYVRVNFRSVVNIVDAVGGIEMELTEAEAKTFTRPWDTNIAPGLCTLNGAQALDYVRLRGIDDDWYRIERQRKCILAVVQTLKGSSFSELNNLCDTVLPKIQTNLTKMEIAELILYSPKFLESEFDQMTIPIANSYGGMTVHSGAGGWALDYEKNNAVLHEFLYGAESEG